MEGVLGDGDTGDPAYMGDDSGMRDGGAGVACGHGSSGPNMDGLRMRLRRTGFDFVSSFCCKLGLGLGLGLSAAGVERETDVAAVSTLAVESSLSLSDETDEVLESEVALRPDSLGSCFLALCAEFVICDDAKRGCRASGGAMCDHDGSRVRGFFARFERASSSSSEEIEREGM